MLGWPDLVLAEHRINGEAVAGLDDNIVRWYYHETPDGVMFQINEMPTWCAAVYAVRYRICTGWHEFVLYDEKLLLEQEADRLRSLLHIDWFTSFERRQVFRSIHPECTGYTWKRIREAGLPQRTTPSQFV
jgi:hypothetical protein